jgi:hypothetical protein
MNETQEYNCMQLLKLVDKAKSLYETDKINLRYYPNYINPLILDNVFKNISQFTNTKIVDLKLITLDEIEMTLDHGTVYSLKCKGEMLWQDVKSHL